MQNLRKINSKHLYSFWSNHIISLLTIMIVIVLSKYVPPRITPIIPLLTASIIYIYLNYNWNYNKTNCTLPLYTCFLCLIAFAFIMIISNLLYYFNFIHLNKEFLFLNTQYVPILTFAPVALITTTIIFLRVRKLNICINCKIKQGSIFERGKIGVIMRRQSLSQLKNYIVIFAILSIITLTYYFFFYVDININQRDRYIFVWVVIITFLIDIIYYLIRYYNIYTALKENDEIIEEAEIESLSTKTYLRFYVICNNYLYIIPQSDNEANLSKIDTPFFIKNEFNSVNDTMALNMIKKASGINDGELKFFYGRADHNIEKYHIIRYFYFLNGKIEDYPQLSTPGRWIDYEKIKLIYYNSPNSLNDLFLADTDRVATILISMKKYDKEGNHRSRIINYTPSFNLIDIRKMNADFQDDMWIKIAIFNADSKFFKIKKRLKNFFKSNKWNSI